MTGAAACDLVLEVRDLAVTHRAARGFTVQAVCGIGFSIAKRETLGLVGESGCGKSSMARAVMQLPRPTGGRVLFCGEELTRMDAKRLRRLRPGFQMIFQDASAALNPRRKVDRIVEEPLRVIGNGSPVERKRCVRDMLIQVGLDPEIGDLRPHRLSGGQCQRIQIARALISRPKLLVCDEPVSSLDVSVQAQIINLLESMRREYGLAMLFISHDLAVVKNISDRVAVMYLGKLCEIAPAESLYHRPAHPYSLALLEAIPRLTHSRQPRVSMRVSEDIPSPASPPTGCRFRTRCPKAETKCSFEPPGLQTIAPGHRVACHFPLTA